MLTRQETTQRNTHHQKDKQTDKQTTSDIIEYTEAGKKKHKQHKHIGMTAGGQNITIKETAAQSLKQTQNT